jgi:hypothetical protein
VADKDQEIYDYRPLTANAAKAYSQAKGLIAAIQDGDAAGIGCAAGGTISSVGLVIAVIPCGKCQVIGGIAIGAGALVSSLACD